MSDFALIGRALDATDERRGSVSDIKPGRKARTLLPSDPPAPGASAGELAAWLTVTLGLGADPIIAAIRYGHADDGRAVITLESGKRITFDKQADLFDAPVLRRRVVIATGATIKHYGSADVQTIATVLIRLAELVDDDDDRSEAREWGRTFLVGAERNTIDIGDFRTPAGRYEALSVLANWKTPTDLMPDAPAAERAALVLDNETGTRLARTSHVAAHVRGIAGRPLSWAALHGRFQEIGWEHRGEVKQRQPQGPAILKAHIYAIPAGWDDE